MGLSSGLKFPPTVKSRRSVSHKILLNNINQSNCNRNRHFWFYRNIFFHNHATFDKHFLLLWRTFSSRIIWIPNFVVIVNAEMQSEKKTFLAISWGLSISLYPNFILILSWFYHLDRIWSNWVLSKLWMKSWKNWDKVENKHFFYHLFWLLLFFQNVL